MPLEVAKFNAMLDEQDKERARAAAALAPSVSPDDAGFAHRIARERELPPGIVMDNLSDYREQAQADEVAAAAGSHPGVGSWLSEPGNSALAKDDLQNLSNLGRLWERLKASAPTTIGGMQQFLGESIEQGFGAVRDRVSEVARAAGPMAARMPGVGSGAIADAGARVAASGADQVDYGRQVRGAAMEGVRRPTSIMDALLHNENTSNYYLGMAADSLFPMGLSMLTGVGGRALMGPSAGVALGSTTMGATTAGSAFGGFRAEGEGYGESARTAIAQGVEEALFETIPMAAALRPGARFGARLANTAFSEGWTEFLTEIAQGQTETVGLDRPQQSVGEMLAQGFDAAMVGTGMGANMAVIGHVSDQTVTRVRDNARAKVERGFLDDQVNLALESKVRQRDPSSFERVLNNLSGGATVYVPVESLGMLYQSEANAQAAVADLTGSQDAWAEAMATGGEVAIPLPKYVTHLAEFHEQLGPKARLRPGQDVRPDTPMPTREDIEASIAQSWKQAGDIDVEAQREGAIFQQLYGQLLGTVGESTAAKQAAVVQHAFTTLETRFGVAPGSIAAGYAFNVNRPESDPGPRRRGVDMQLDPIIDQVIAERDAPALNPVRGFSLVQSIIDAGGLDPGAVGAGDLKSIQRPGLFKVGGSTVEAMAESLAQVDTGLSDLFTTKDEFGRPDYRELIEMLRDEVAGTRTFEPVLDEAKAAARQQAEQDKASVKAALEAIGLRGVDTSKLSREELRALVEAELDSQQQLEQGSVHEEALTSRLAQWFASLRVGGSGPRTVGARPEGIGTVTRNAGGAAEQGDASREEIRDQSQRLIERAKAEGFFWGADHPILFTLHGLPANGGAEHQVFAVGSGDDRIIIRATDNGYFGPRSDISPAQYLARLDDYSSSLPNLQTRLIGVSESTEVKGHAVIWTAQPFVRGHRFATQSLLVEAMEAHGWEVVDDPHSYAFRHKETGTVITDAHTENVFYDDAGDLYPFDVVVEALPNKDVLFQSEQPFYSALLQSVEQAKGAPKKADATAWKQWLDGAQSRGEFTQEELKWLGLKEWLDEIASSTDPQVQQVYPDGQILREQIREFVRANELVLEEEVVEGSARTAAARRALADDGITMLANGDLLHYGAHVDIQDLREPMQRAVQILSDNEIDTSAPEAPFANMTLPGGTGYKLFKLRMPPKEGSDFTGGHFDTNTILHIRADERVDADGKRVLFIAEAQSDWHQQGRRKGYQGVPSFKYPSVEEMATQIGWVIRDATRDELRGFGLNDTDTATHVTYPDGSTTLYSPRTIADQVKLQWRNELFAKFYNGKGDMSDADWTALSKQVEDMERDDRLAINGGVPDAPFKTTWPELALKRMIRYAAENGFDRVAWPTVEQVPQIEQWGMTLEEIRADPDKSKRFGAILARYETDIPRIAKKLAKKYGGELVQSGIGAGANDVDVVTRFHKKARTALLRVPMDAQAADSILSAISTGLDDEVSNGFSVDRNGVEVIRGLIDDFASDTDDDMDQEELDGVMYAATALRTALDEAVAEADPIMVPAIEITPKLREAALAGLPLFQKQGGEQGPRGGITGTGGQSIIGDRGVDGKREFNISLFAGMDYTTFLHENGHAFLEIMGDLAEREDAPQQLKDDWQKVLQTLEVSDRGQIQRKQHERFAGLFEDYLARGVAPSRALRRVFAAFKVWFKGVYRSLRQADVPLSDDIVGVFDRLLATDAEIAEVKQTLGLGGLAQYGQQLGMTPEQVRALSDAELAADADAEGALGAEVLGEQQKAARAFLGAERKKVRAEVEAVTRALKPYRALRWLRQGKLPDGSAVPQAIKLSRQDLLDSGLTPEFLRKRLSGTYAKAGGMHPDVAAELLGYGSGAELVEDIVNAPLLSAVIKADTDRIMAERYPDPLVDGSLADRALVVVHREKRAEAMLLGLQALERRVDGRVRSQGHILKEAARRLVGAKRAYDLQPHSYLMAERKAGREAVAALAKQDWPAAKVARQKQLLSHHLWREATRARAEVDKAQRMLRKLGKTKARQKLGLAGFVEQVDALLERFDFRQVSGAASERRARLAEFIAAQKADGVEVNLPLWLQDEGRPFRELSVAEVRDLRDAVKHLVHMANEANHLRLGNELRDRAAVDLEVGDSIRAENKARPVVGPTQSFGDSAREFGLQVRGIQGNAADLAQELDGFKELGGVFRHVVQVVRDAIHNEVNPRKEKARQTLADLYLKHYTKKELRGLWKAEGRTVMGGAKWDKGQILVLALNRGNAGNVQAMLDQVRWKLTMSQIDSLLSTLDSRDWQFVQDVAAYLDTFREEAFAATKRRTGLAPKRVEGTPFVVQTSDGKTLSLPGWYFPLSYVPDGTVSASKEMEEAYDQLRAGFNPLADVTAGSQIERVGSGGRTVKFDLGVIEAHLSDVIRGTYLADAINYSHKVMHGTLFREAVRDTGMLEHSKALQLWLKDAATGEIVLRNRWEQGMRMVRSNFVASKLTWKATTAILQWTGIASTASALGPVWTGHGLRVFLTHPLKMGRYADEASPLIKQRSGAIVDSIEQLHASKAGLFRSLRSGNMKWGMWLIGRFQRHVDLITWLGAEARGMEMFGQDVKKARVYADDMVIRTQGTQEFIDKNALLRGTVNEGVRQTEFVRSLMALQGYMLTKGNLAYRGIAQAKVGEMRLNAASANRALKLMSNMILLFAVDGILSALVRGDWPDDDDEDGSILDDWLLFAGTQTGWSVLGAFPGGSSMVSGMRGYDAQGVVSAAWSEVGNLIEQANQQKLDKAFLKAAVTTLGTLTGAPSAQINKTIDAVDRRNDGYDVSPYEYLAGPKKD